jgi:MAX-like protein X
MLHPSQQQQQQQQQLNQQSQFAQVHSQSLPINLNPQQNQQLVSMGPISTSTQDIYKSPQSPSYKSYHGLGQQPYKIPSQSAGSFNMSRGINMRQQSPPHAQTAKALQQQQQATIKEMYRSNSLPINTTVIQLQNMQKEDNFVMPRYQVQKSGQRGASQQHSRSRSNSMIMRQGQQGFPLLQAANSEPTLNASSALLAQLLTSTNQSGGLLGKTTTAAATQLQQQQQRTVSANQLFSPNSNNTTPLVQTPQNSNASSIQLSSKQQSQTSSSSTSQSSTSSSYLYSANTPTLSPDSAIDHDLPLSPDRGGNSSSGGGSTSLLSKYQPRESQRRAGHIHAEQKRRYNIKNGFDMLHSLIPQLQQNPNAKLSKASMLQKGAEYIKQLRMERSAVHEQMEALRKEIDTLNNSLNHLHTALPANGVPVSRQGNVKEMYNEYVMQRTKQNWKFWIFGLIFEPLMNSYNSTVSVASLEELCRTAQLWVDNSCSLVEIRPAVSNKLRELSTTTDILSDNPTSLQEEVMRIVAMNSNSKKNKQNPQNEGPS